ncbi:type II CRISPR RNA-guided endonuclease Cas9 [Lactobacillaceae bacterium L1_55_11]|nr:type II CRISPR RNA-guided endonuclease Cas9 [Lactobacillaceae bacterium L1_55_11]
MKYSIGLDIGTTSVGWVALNEDGKLARAKGKNLIGVRLFKEADTAAERRSFRTTRRRLSRRRWRLGLLSGLFAPELNKLDKNFLSRLKFSYVNAKDEANQQHYYGGYVFGSSEADKQFYQHYPTIYHLRKALMNDDKQHDLREVYLAIHHIVKYRGNFLSPQEYMSVGKTYNPDEFKKAVHDYAEAKGLSWSLTDVDGLTEALLSKRLSKRAKAEKGLSFFDYEHDDKSAKKAIEAMLNGLVGNQIDFSKVFYDLDIPKENKNLWKLNLGDEEFEEKADAFINELDPDQLDLFEAIKKAYDGFALMAILNNSSSISDAMISSYQKHKDDLKLLRQIGRQQLNKEEFSGLYEKFLKDGNAKPIKNLVAKSNLSDSEKERINLDIDNNNFLPKQRTKANGLLPYQLHLAELSKIIEKQGKYYPFLLEKFTDDKGREANKIEELVRFRIPYYVGPMISVADTKGNSDNHWVRRLPGQKGKQVTPWNFERIFNRDLAARDFIERLTGSDTYLIGEDTLPKHSPLYQEFTVLNELNNVRVDGKKLDRETKRDVVDQLFKRYKNVTKKRLADYLVSNGKPDVRISGLADETRFNSTLDTYIDLNQVFDAEFMDNESNAKLLEKIVEIQTVFEDQDIATRELDKLDVLSPEQVEKLAKKHYTGWGNLSLKLLTTPMIMSANGQNSSIMDKLRSTSKNFIQIITNSDYGVQDWIKQQNLDNNDSSLQEKIDELTTSPANKRGIRQAFNVINDIAKAMKAEPDRIYLEFARETQNSVRTVARKNRVEGLYRVLPQTEEVKALKEEIAGADSDAFADEKVYLYFLQEGKDMYTGRPIDLSQLSQQYDVDHIIPQAFTKDDSIDNKVLVNRTDNARKSNSATFTTEIQQGPAGQLWRHLCDNKLISEKKYQNLTRNHDFSDDQKAHFINRQLVETRQIIKNVATLIEGEFDKTKAVAIRSEITADMRRLVKIKKHRDINSYHHAFDALLVTAAGQYIAKHFASHDDQFVHGAFDRYANAWLKEYRKNSHSSEARRLKPLGFVVGTMGQGNADWSETDTEYLRHVMSFKNILSTKRVGKDRGPLYKQTVNPADPKKPFAPINKSKQDTTIYGGYTQIEAAYTSLVRAAGKNRFVKISMAEANKINDGSVTLAEVVSGKTKGFEKILIGKVPLGQLVNDTNGKVFIASSEYQHNANQLWLSTEDANTVADVLSRESDDQDLMKVFDILTSPQVIKRFPLYRDDLVYTRENRDVVQASSDKKDGLDAILDSLQLDASEKKPLKKFNKSLKEWHRLQSGSGIVLTDNAEIIYQSPTGLFEKRIKVADLL